MYPKVVVFLLQNLKIKKSNTICGPASVGIH